ncbi:hypothetical protein MBM_02023 [Drepanopeziza brunnea f. sp. 'multigermtubi' MB_m1]|uniref:Uncharacterized protein n=1 Tax=Marssonina brunnea f. sp. multigermtubi (strain MB_m1) TaxID=1072389 RepID=K1X4G8_MARBU|nr:uncharacterized protein MBM_02023 [Drepanopeziza brunnea f. sp. 'multigermtubi' MB_m1]EKD20071.1 hypothetical protein MBM_02023 [Drepanopeziza brunnea f. sp. 'multigermtubi' MB_m1]
MENSGLEGRYRYTYTMMTNDESARKIKRRMEKAQQRGREGTKEGKNERASVGGTASPMTKRSSLDEEYPPNETATAAPIGSSYDGRGLSCNPAEGSHQVPCDAARAAGSR